MKNKNYPIIILLAMFCLISCDKHEIEFNAEPVGDMAEFQIHMYTPVDPAASRTDLFMYKIEVNGEMISNNITPLSTYNAQPSSAVGMYFTANQGQVNLKMYQSTKLNLAYDQTVKLERGKHNLVVYDLTKPPIIFDTEYPFEIDRGTYDTDTIAFVKFYNFLYEDPNTPTTLKIQYQYRKHWVHPLYTLYDEMNGTIPEGKKVGDKTGTVDGKDMGPWVNLGTPISFGETTGWQIVPVEKNTFVSQGSARLDYRILVVEGGILDDGTMLKGNMNADKILLAQTTSGTKPAIYSDYWNSTVGRRIHHFLAGTRKGKPGSGVRTFTCR
jgi:hypothetical protein